MKRKISILVTLLMLVGVMQIAAFAKKDMTIVDIAASDPQFSTLVTAIDKAGLKDALSGKGPFTVFAPTNKAFEKLPAGTVESLLKPENKDVLVNILTYHVTPGKLTSKDIAKLDGKEIKMLNDKMAKITIKDGKAYINDAEIIMKDIKADNGIIHVIDTVILPAK